MGDMAMPGFRFHPTEEELVSFYLQKQLMGINITPSAYADHYQQQLHRVILVVDIYNHNPWDLPKLAGEFCQKDSEQWIFFVPRQEREARGGRPKRITSQGYWKATGSPVEVYSSQNTLIGRKRTMVFYAGRVPHGTKTAWKMNEYKAIMVQAHHEAAASSSSSAANPQIRDEFSLCRIYRRLRTLRAFDRALPPWEAISNGEPQVAVVEADANYIINPAAAPGITCDWSLDRSSPAGGDSTSVNPCQLQSEAGNEEDTMFTAAADGEPSWEWEQLNWLFDI